jgi:hypothetical protein
MKLRTIAEANGVESTVQALQKTLKTSYAFVDDPDLLVKHILDGCNRQTMLLQDQKWWDALPTVFSPIPEDAITASIEQSVDEMHQLMSDPESLDQLKSGVITEGFFSSIGNMLKTVVLWLAKTAWVGAKAVGAGIGAGMALAGRHGHGFGGHGYGGYGGVGRYQPRQPGQPGAPVPVMPGQPQGQGQPSPIFIGMVNVQTIVFFLRALNPVAVQTAQQPKPNPPSRNRQQAAAQPPAPPKTATPTAPAAPTGGTPTPTAGTAPPGATPQP